VIVFLYVSIPKLYMRFFFVFAFLSWPWRIHLGSPKLLRPLSKINYPIRTQSQNRLNIMLIAQLVYLTIW